MTSSQPAIPGEVLTMLVRNLGPTNPAVAPGAPFPRNPLTVVTSPLEVLVNGAPAGVTFAGGEPGAVGIYEVEFGVPPTTAPGRATVQILIGFLKGPEFQIVVSP